jgi:hypothetical protein
MFAGEERRMLKRLSIVTIFAAALASLAIAACSSDNNKSSPGASADASADSAVVVEAGTDAGADGAPITDAGAVDGRVNVLGVGLSPGATYSKSANYRMMWTRGGGNGVSTSSKYKMQSGISGATGK